MRRWLRRLVGREERARTDQQASPVPRIISLSMVKNEQDIIEPFARHNLAFLDAMIVMDNGSDDETRRILAELMRELPGLVVTDDPAFGYNQAERMARMLAAAQSVYRADYVLFLDADEFIDASSRAEFEAALTKIPAGGLGLVLWHLRAAVHRQQRRLKISYFQLVIKTQSGVPTNIAQRRCWNGAYRRASRSRRAPLGQHS
jgi:glycosyltransferase involved in cell wall biosynthesis